MNLILAFTIYLSVLIFIMFLYLSKVNVKDFKSFFKNKKVERIKKLNEEEILKREIEKELKREKREQKSIIHKFIQNVEDTLSFIKLNISINEFMIASMVIGLIGFAFSYFIFNVISISLFAYIVSFFLPYLIVTNIENRIIKKANKNTSAFIAVVRETSIGTNNGLNAIEKAIKTTKEPMKSLIKDCVDKSKNLKIPIEKSIIKLGRDMKNDYLLIFGVALKKQKETGNNFREYLNSVYKIIETDERIDRLNIKETSYGTRVFQMFLIIYIVQLLILRLFFYNVFEMLIKDPIGNKVLALSLVFIIINGIGIYLIRKE